MWNAATVGDPWHGSDKMCQTADLRKGMLTGRGDVRRKEAMYAMEVSQHARSSATQHVVCVMLLASQHSLVCHNPCFRAWFELYVSHRLFSLLCSVLVGSHLELVMNDAVVAANHEARMELVTDGLCVWVAAASICCAC